MTSDLVGIREAEDELVRRKKSGEIRDGIREEVLFTITATDVVPHRIEIPEVSDDTR
jgi:hypothetical protein